MPRVVGLCRLARRETRLWGKWACHEVGKKSLQPNRFKIWAGWAQWEAHGRRGDVEVFDGKIGGQTITFEQQLLGFTDGTIGRHWPPLSSLGFLHCEDRGFLSLTSVCLKSWSSTCHIHLGRHSFQAKMFIDIIFLVNYQSC